MCFAQGHKTVRLKPATPWSQCKHSTNESLRSHYVDGGIIDDVDDGLDDGNIWWPRLKARSDDVDDGDV